MCRTIKINVNVIVFNCRMHTAIPTWLAASMSKFNETNAKGNEVLEVNCWMCCCVIHKQTMEQTNAYGFWGTAVTFCVRCSICMSTLLQRTSRECFIVKLAM